VCWWAGVLVGIYSPFPPLWGYQLSQAHFPNTHMGLRCSITCKARCAIKSYVAIHHAEIGGKRQSLFVAQPLKNAFISFVAELRLKYKEIYKIFAQVLYFAHSVIIFVTETRGKAKAGSPYFFYFNKFTR
jgi:hypothetical protein